MIVNTIGVGAWDICNMDYLAVQTGVVPEPISAILFLMGIFLAKRKFF